MVADYIIGVFMGQLKGMPIVGKHRIARGFELATDKSTGYQKEQPPSI